MQLFGLWGMRAFSSLKTGPDNKFSFVVAIMTDGLDVAPSKTSAAIYMETGTGRLLLSLHSKHLQAFCRKDSSDPFRITHTQK